MAKYDMFLILHHLMDFSYAPVCLYNYKVILDPKVEEEAVLTRESAFTEEDCPRRIRRNSHTKHRLNHGSMSEKNDSSYGVPVAAVA